MWSRIETCFLASVLSCWAAAQDMPKPALRAGVSVQMAAAAQPVEVRAADDANAMVVAITADGKVYANTRLTGPSALSSLKEETVYVKADARVPYQTVLSVLDALRGKTVVLLTASPANAVRQGYAPPYGILLKLPR